MWSTTVAKRRLVISAFLVTTLLGLAGFLLEWDVSVSRVFPAFASSAGKGDRQQRTTKTWAVPEHLAQQLHDSRAPVAVFVQAMHTDKVSWQPVAECVASVLMGTSRDIDVLVSFGSSPAGGEHADRPAGPANVKSKQTVRTVWTPSLEKEFMATLTPRPFDPATTDRLDPKTGIQHDPVSGPKSNNANSKRVVNARVSKLQVSLNPNTPAGKSNGDRTGSVTAAQMLLDQIVATAEAGANYTLFLTAHTFPNSAGHLQDRAIQAMCGTAPQVESIVRQFQRSDATPPSVRWPFTTSSAPETGPSHEQVARNETQNDSETGSDSGSAEGGVWPAVNLYMVAPLGTLVGPSTQLNASLVAGAMDSFEVASAAAGENLLGSSIFGSSVLASLQKAAGLAASSPSPAVSPAAPNVPAGKSGRRLEPETTVEPTSVAGSMFWAFYPAVQEAATRAKYALSPAIAQHFIPTVVRAVLGSNIAMMPPAPKTLGIFFPQYHRFPENDRLWGEGFTEWTLLKPFKAPSIRKPLPVEKGGLGYYNLTHVDVRRRQADLARRGGVYGFMYYHYWFVGDKAPKDFKVMWKPLELRLADGEPDLPFMLTWANEHWSERWGGKSSGQVLLSLALGTPENWEKHLDYLMQFFKHPKYIRVGGEPVFGIYNLGYFGEKMNPMLELWTKLAREKYGLPGLHLINALSHTTGPGLVNLVNNVPSIAGSYHFHPLVKRVGNKVASQYDLAMPELEPPVVFSPNHVEYWGADVGFDRRVRDGQDHPTVNIPKRHIHHTVFSAALTCSFAEMTHLPQRKVRQNLFFLTAWNEWNEQAVLEPSDLDGFGQLAGLRAAVSNVPGSLWQDETVVGPRRFSDKICSFAENRELDPAVVFTNDVQTLI